MFGPIDLAMGALSSVAALFDSTASGIGKTAIAAPPLAFNASPSPAVQPSLINAPRNPGVPIPKFDQRTQAALLALQEQHRGA